MNITITETTYEHVRMMLHELLDEWQILNKKLKAAESLAASRLAELEKKETQYELLLDEFGRKEVMD